MSKDFWQSQNFRIEPWGNDYQQAQQTDEELAVSASEVDANVETDDWQPYRPVEWRSLPNQVIFIDGCRRIDAPLIGGTADEIIYGVFGTVAAGAVVIDRSVPAASYSEIKIERIVGFGNNLAAQTTAIPCPFGSNGKLVYQPVAPSAANNPDVRGQLVQKAMLAAERQLAETFSTVAANTLVIRDGRLPYTAPISAVGYIKSMYKNYLSEDRAALLRKLVPGERSPIFLIKEKNRPRWSWYLKSGDPKLYTPNLGYHSLHGIVRLELYSEVPLPQAQQIADHTTYLIPHYASHPSRDPRAPQNLNPVGALEKELGKRMGDKAVIQRRLQAFLNSGGNP